MHIVPVPRHLPHWPRLSPLTRFSCVVAAAVVSVTLHMGLLGLFDHASSQPWLTPTPATLQAAASCDAQHDRGARDRCMQELVRRTLAAARQGVQVAAR